jgi:circadian clock protein KaiB
MKVSTQINGKVAPVKDPVIQLRLYVAAQPSRSLAARTNWKRICADHWEWKYEFEVIDLAKNSQFLPGDRILAIPTHVRSLPVPIRKIIGDLSNVDCVLVGLDLRGPERKLAVSSPRNDRRIGANV